MSSEQSPARDGGATNAAPAKFFLTEVETAQLLNVSQRTLQRWRLEGSQGLPFRRFGGLIRYARSRHRTMGWRANTDVHQRGWP